MAPETPPGRGRLGRQGQETRARAGRIGPVRVPQRRLLAGILLLVAVAVGFVLWRSSVGLVPETSGVKFFNIATGPTSGTYFPVGQTIAAVVSEPPGSEACAEQARCGVPGLLAVVKSSPGSTANVRSLVAGRYDAALVQADVANWAFHGSGAFQGEPVSDLRAIAALYPEAVHLVARRGAEIGSVGDLAGKRVSIDRAGSGTQADAVLVLKAHGLDRTDIVAEELEVSDAADRLIAGTLDAFFLVSGAPAAVVSDLARDGHVDLVAIDGPAAEALVESSGFFVAHTIPAQTYRDLGETRTMSVRALLVTTEAVDADLIHDVTAALWRPGNRTTLDRGHAKGALIRLDTALDGIPIPLHPGAEAYYREVGRLPAPAAASRSEQE